VLEPRIKMQRALAPCFVDLNDLEPDQDLAGREDLTSPAHGSHDLKNLARCTLNLLQVTWPNATCVEARHDSIGSGPGPNHPMDQIDW